VVATFVATAQLPANYRTVRIVTIPTLTEIYQTKKAEQVTKQQTSLLTAILELHESLRNLNQPQGGELQFRVQQLEEQLAQLEAENKVLLEENSDLNRELDLHEKTESEAASLSREVDFQAERFKVLQQHYKNSTDYSKELQEELKATKAQLAIVNLQSAPKGFKSWEEAATTERLHHNQTKAELANLKDELAATRLKLDRFQKLFREALGQ
jgi:chromosome segregation ATPase